MEKFFGVRKNNSSRIQAWIKDKVSPAMGRMGNQVHLSSIRDSFSMMAPLFFCSAVAVLLLTVVFGGWGGEKSSLLGAVANWFGATDSTTNSSFMVMDHNSGSTTLSSWGLASSQMEKILGSINYLGMGLMTVYFTFFLGFFLSRARGHGSPEIAGLLAVGCFFVATAGGSSSVPFHFLPSFKFDFQPDYKGVAGVFTSIATTIVSIEIFCFFSKKVFFRHLAISRIPPGVSRYFGDIVPFFISAGSIALILGIIALPTSLTGAPFLTRDDFSSGSFQFYFSNTNGFYNIGDLIYMFVQSPIIYAISISEANLAFSVVYAFLTGLFWFSGVHGPDALDGLFLPFLYVLLGQNALFLEYGQSFLDSHGIIFVKGVFDAFIVIGGTGATLPLIFSSLVFGRRNKNETNVAKFSLVPGIYKTNEPLLFGFPIVANIKYAIPYLFCMPILTVATWLLYKTFNTSYVALWTSWVLPHGVGSLFATRLDWSSAVIALINLIIGMLVWTPFVVWNNRKNRKIN